jgi:uncharacterized protein
MRTRVACYWLSLRATASAFAVAVVIGNSSYGAAGLSNPAEPTECDRLAGNPVDPDLPKGFPGVLNGEQIDPDAAIPACRRALDNTPGDRRVRFQLGRALQRGKKFEEAKLEYEQAASAGAASAMNALGGLYASGQGVAKDYAQARAWYQKSADQGDAAAIANLKELPRP